MDADELARLEWLAQEMACRVRDYDPIANGRWLQATTTPDERWQLLFVMAAAIPTDVPWKHLTRWVDLPAVDALVAERFGRAA
ncbi:MAG TPA: hypothetical protein VF174_15710 [Micromonosporaceae bacterium]